MTIGRPGNAAGASGLRFGGNVETLAVRKMMTQLGLTLVDAQGQSVHLVTTTGTNPQGVSIDNFSLYERISR